jgi:hypothetical protein
MSTPWKERFRVHWLADMFPMMPADEITDLAADIKANGLRKKIVLQGASFEDALLLDGRNRLAALELAGIEVAPEHCVIAESMADAVAYILSANAFRRHLTKEKRAALIIAVNPPQVGEVSKGGRGKIDKAKAEIVTTAAKQGVSKRTVERVMAKAREPHEPGIGPSKRAQEAPGKGQAAEVESGRRFPHGADDRRRVAQGISIRLQDRRP